MKNAEIYRRAIDLIDRKLDEEILYEYTIRAPYILGGFFYENRNLDNRCREIFDCGRRKYTHSVYADLASDFPFLQCFETAAEYYTAAILVLDDDVDAGDEFYGLYVNEISKIISELPVFPYEVNYS